MKKIFLLGATGSVGQNTLKVIAENKDLFSLIGIQSTRTQLSLKKLWFVIKIFVFKRSSQDIRDQSKP